MQIPLQVTFRHMAHSPALEAAIRDKVAALEHLHPRIRRCRVVVSELGLHSRQGRQFEVALDLGVTGSGDVVANRRHDEDAFVALRDAFDATRQQLEDVTRDRRAAAPSDATLD
jgi:ribosome-associated translation inhibitor RaiA